VLAERGIRPTNLDADDGTLAGTDSNDDEFLQDVRTLLRLAEEYEHNLRFAASFTATVPDSAIDVRKTIADAICDLYRDPLDEKERRVVRFNLPREAFRLGFVELDSPCSGEIFGSYCRRKENPKQPMDGNELQLSSTPETSSRRDGEFLGDQDQDQCDPESTQYGSGMKTFFDSESENDTEEP
jgi:hypothetical protein